MSDPILVEPLTDYDLALARETFSGTAWPVPQLIGEIDRLRAIEAAARDIWDRIDGLFDEEDMDPESSFAMSVPMKGRHAGALRTALEADHEH